MKKLALLVALFMVVGGIHGFSYTATVDNVLESKSKSELHPVQDAARLAGVVNSGINKAIDTKPIATVMTPVEKGRKGILKGTYKITNTLWDFLTFRHFREKKK